MTSTFEKKNDIIWNSERQKVLVLQTSILKEIVSKVSIVSTLAFKVNDYLFRYNYMIFYKVTLQCKFCQNHCQKYNPAGATARYKSNQDMTGPILVPDRQLGHANTHMRESAHSALGISQRQMCLHFIY